MRPRGRARDAWSVGLGLLGVLLGVASCSPESGTGGERALVVRDAWVEPSPTGRGPAGAFLTVANGTDRPRSLLGASSPAASRVELHRSRIEGGVARMEPLDAIEIPAGGTRSLHPGGDHLMLFGADGLEPGGRVPLRLVFDGGEARTIEAEVRPAGGGHAHAPSTGHPGSPEPGSD